MISTGSALGVKRCFVCGTPQGSFILFNLELTCGPCIEAEIGRLRTFEHHHREDRIVRQVQRVAIHGVGITNRFGTQDTLDAPE